MLDVTAAVRNIRVPHEPYLRLESFHDLRVMCGANKDFPRRPSTDGNVWLFCDHNCTTFLWAQNDQLLQAKTLTHKECSVLMIVHWRTRRAILKHFLLLRLYWTLRVWHRSKFNSVLTRLTLSCTNAKELNTGLSDQKDSTPPRMKFLAHLFLFAKEFRQLHAWLTKRGQSYGQ